MVNIRNKSNESIYKIYKFISELYLILYFNNNNLINNSFIFQQVVYC